MIGLDIGTSMLVSAKESRGKIKYKAIRDAFLKITPKTKMQASMMEKSLKSKSYFKDGDSFILIGQDAINEAVVRNTSAFRPMKKGVIDPSYKEEAQDVLRFIIKDLLGKPKENNGVVYSVPAQPIDMDETSFDVGFHKDLFNGIISSLGFIPTPLNEAEAICYAELMEEDLTGIGVSWGAGMINICVMAIGEPILTISLSRSGDWIDRMVALATNNPDSVVQTEKEGGGFNVAIEGADINSLSPVQQAIVISYQRLANYFWTNLNSYLSHIGDRIPRFSKPISIVLSGGTASVDGFRELIGKTMPSDFVIPIGNIKMATDPLRTVATGCLLYGQANE